MKQQQGEATGEPEPPCENLLVGVTGSIGAVAVPQFLFLVRQSFAKEVHVMMSRAAQKFVSPYVLRLFSGNHVLTDSFQITDEVKVPHIELTRRADLLLIMPATANIIGKAANGICDDLISTSIVACKSPVVFVPSMNEAMWSNKAIQQNVEKLRSFGYHLIEPSSGYEITDMKQTYGAMPTFPSILEQLEKIMAGGGEEILSARAR
jgi:phosphopantothenoylcysteine synthetase/decarboxylase